MKSVSEGSLILTMSNSSTQGKEIPISALYVQPANSQEQTDLPGEEGMKERRRDRRTDGDTSLTHRRRV